MGFFDDANEVKRKQNLKELEDKRLRFAEKMQKEGFAPEHMIAVSTDAGGFVGFCRDKGQLCLVIAPNFGGEGEFVLERYDVLETRKEDYFEPAEGMGGAFGFGKKGQSGFFLKIAGKDEELSVPFIANRNSAAEWGKRNPVLSVKRRRGDANVVWDMQPMDKRLLAKIERKLDQILA